MQQSHSREHEHPKPDFALIGDTFVQDHQNSSSKYTIVDNCWDAGHCGNITKLPPKKSPESQNCDEQFSFRKNKKNWQKLGEQNSFYERKFATEYTCLCKTFAKISKRKDYYS
jgi:hypothetical protein